MDFFIQMCKKNLHMVLCFSPVGDIFKKRLRTFPYLINCSTIDWFLPWPKEALKTVSEKLLDEVELPDNSVKPKISEIFVQMQTKVIDLSVKYREELRRYYYVTPTSYLELIKCFSKMIKSR